MGPEISLEWVMVSELGDYGFRFKELGPITVLVKQQARYASLHSV